MCLTFCKPLADDQRVAYTAALFGLDFPLRIEPTIFAMAGHLSADYTGGLWEFYALSNGGFYMAPKTDEPFMVRCENGFAGQLSSEAFGIAVCLYAYSELSFTESAVAVTCAEQYHLVREHALDHREAGVIMAAID